MAESGESRAFATKAIPRRSPCAISCGSGRRRCRDRSQLFRRRRARRVPPRRPRAIVGIGLVARGDVPPRVRARPARHRFPTIARRVRPRALLRLREAPLDRSASPRGATTRSSWLSEGPRRARGSIGPRICAPASCRSTPAAPSTAASSAPSSTRRPGANSSATFANTKENAASSSRGTASAAPSRPSPPRRHPNSRLLYTFGAPKVGDRDFARNTARDHQRIVNGRDLVPRLPSPALRPLGRPPRPRRPRLPRRHRRPHAAHLRPPSVECLCWGEGEGWGWVGRRSAAHPEGSDSYHPALRRSRADLPHPIPPPHAVATIGAEARKRRALSGFPGSDMFSVRNPREQLRRGRDVPSRPRRCCGPTDRHIKDRGQTRPGPTHPTLVTLARRHANNHHPQPKHSQLSIMMSTGAPRIVAKRVLVPIVAIEYRCGSEGECEGCERGRAWEWGRGLGWVGAASAQGCDRNNGSVAMRSRAPTHPTPPPLNPHPRSHSPPTPILTSTLSQPQR